MGGRANGYKTAARRIEDHYWDFWWELGRMEEWMGQENLIEW